MTCTQCNTNFCYRCGERYRHLRFFGDHTSNLSVFGCKYRYLPNKPHLRRLIRGSVCATKLLIAPVVTLLVVVLGALALVIGLVVFPVYYVCKRRKKQRTQGSGRWIWNLLCFSSRPGSHSLKDNARISSGMNTPAWVIAESLKLTIPISGVHKLIEQWCLDDHTSILYLMRPLLQKEFFHQVILATPPLSRIVLFTRWKCLTPLNLNQISQPPTVLGR